MGLVGAVDGAARLAALRASGLLDTATEPAFDRLTRLAARLLRVPVAAFTLVDDQRQLFKSAVGISDASTPERQLPLSHSFCRLVVESAAPVRIEDARLDERVCGNPSIAEHDAISYLGVPIALSGGAPLGALCVLDRVPRSWSSDDLDTLLDLATSIVAELELKQALQSVDRHAQLLRAVLDSMGDGVLVLDADGTFSHVNSAAERMLGPASPGWSPSWAQDTHLFESDGVTPVVPERDPLARALRGTVSVNVDLVRRNDTPGAEGERRITFDAHPVRGAEGTVRAGVAVVRDTTRRRAAELELQASEERYRLLAEHASDLVLVVTADRRILYASPSSERLLGYTPDELISLGRTILFRKDETAMLGARFEAMVTTGIGGEPVLHRFRTKSGEERWFETSLQPVRGVRGTSVTRIYTTSRDITERIEAQRALSEREQRTRRLADAAFEGISISHEGALVDGNAAFARLFGYEPWEIGGMDIETFVMPDERDRRGAERSQPEDAHRTIGRHKDGSRFPIEVRSSHIPWGTRTVQVTAIRDITARVAGEQTMRMHGAILGSMAEGVCLARIGDSRIVYANPRFAEMFGYQTAETSGLSIDDLLAPDTKALAPKLRIVAETAGRTTFEARNVKKDGTPLWTRATTSSMVHPDHGKVLVVVVEDITARRHEAEALERQTGFVELLRRTATEANAASRSGEAMQACLSRVCAHMGWPFGHALAGDGSLIAATSATITGSALHVVGSVPVLAGPEVVAVLEFFSESNPPEDEAVHAVLADIGLQLGRVVERERTRAALERHSAEVQALALIDELTGLRNRRGFMTLATHQLRIASRTHRGALLFFADLNGMKRINDQHGHDAGDIAIRATADVLRASFRDADIIARLGGDEFVVYAPDANPDAVAILRARVAGHVAAYNERGEQPFRLSVSLGVAIYDPNTPRTLDELLAEADSAMYEQKRQSGAQRAGA